MSFSASQIPFSPLGNTVVISAASTAPTAVQVSPTSGQMNVGQYRCVNSGTVMVFLGVGSTATIAGSRAVIPIAGTPASGVPLMPGAVEILRFNENSYITAITSSGTATVYVTPGQGL